jgi:hypothetical protein
LNLADEVRKLKKDIALLNKLIIDLRGAGGGGGEANTASNQGVGGVGLYNSKVGVDLQFKNINAGSTKISVTNDVPNKEVDIDVAPANIKLDDLGTPDNNTDLNATITEHGLLPKLDNDPANFLNGQGAWAAPAAAAHHATHEEGGADEIKLDDLATPDDNTDLNATIAEHGLLKKLPNDAAKFLNGVGAWANVGGGTAPLFYQGVGSRRWGGLVAHGGTAVSLFGMGATVVGSVTSNPQDDGAWTKLSCTSSAPGGYRGIYTGFRRIYSPTIWFRMKTDADLTNFRLFLTITDSLYLVWSDDPTGAGNRIGFRYSSTAGTANWYFVMKDTVAQTATDTGVAVAANTVYDFKIYLPSGGNAYWDVTPLGGGTTSGNSNANIPGDSVDLGMQFTGCMIGAGQRYWNVGSFYYEEDL